MAKGDKWRFDPKTVGYHRDADGTRLPSLFVNVYLTPGGTETEIPWGYFEVHMHEVWSKVLPRASLGLTSRLGPHHDATGYNNV